MISLRRMLLQIALPLTKILNKLHISPSARCIKRDDVEAAKTVLIPGDMIVTLTNGQLSNQLIPGDWKHCAMYVGSDFVVEAVSSGVVKTDLYDFLMSKDSYAIVRPYISCVQMYVASVKVESFIGKKYDFFFEASNEAFYCAELMAAAYLFAAPEFRFEKRKIMGIDTIMPSDYYNAKEKFFIVKEKRGNK